MKYVSSALTLWTSKVLCALFVLAAAQLNTVPALSGADPTAEPAILEKIRGGRHTDYISIVFQFDRKALSETPVVRGDEVVFLLKSVKTDLPPIHSYEDLDSWVRLQEAGSGLNVRMGLPENISNMRHFQMESPDRLVINLYGKKTPSISSSESESSGNSNVLPLPAKKPLKQLVSVAEKTTEKQETSEQTPAPPTISPPQGPEKSEGIADQLAVTGLLTLNFHEVEIRELLSALAIKREINIVMNQDVSGKVSLHLYGVNLDEAIQAIGLAGGFNHMKHGNTYYVYKPKKDADPEAERLQMRIFELQYAAVEKIQEVLDVIPNKHVIKFHEPSKTVIVEDTPENIRKIKFILDYWDKKPRQVLIEAKILEVNLTDEMSLGVDWDKIFGDARLATGGFSSAVPPTVEGVSPVPGVGAGLFANFITGAATSHQLTIALDALQAKTKVNILSTPKILAIHGKRARVQVGGQQGYKLTTVTSTGLATETIEFLDTGTILDITPYIDDEENVLLEVKPSINSVTVDSATGVPTVNSTSVSTWLLAKTGETVFIGGLIQDRKTDTRSMVPCFGNIPGLGWLFRATSRSAGKMEFVVLITPHIAKSERRLVDQESIEKAKAVEDSLQEAPLPFYKELLDPWNLGKD